MRAVNLIPRESRRGGAAVSRSGGGAYLVLAVLAGLVLMTAVYALEGGKIDDKNAEAAQAKQETATKQAEATKLGSYTAFAQLKNKRVQTVTDLANNRFDWSNTMYDLARAIPPNTWLTSMTGTVAPGVNVEGGGGGSGLRSTIEAPAIELSGCTTSQPAVAKMMARMRLLDGVDRVTLTSSEKPDTSSSASGSATDGGCASVSDQYPTFNIIVFFKPLESQAGTQPAAATQAAVPGTTTPTGASQ